MSASVTVQVKGPHGALYPVTLDADFAEDFDPLKWRVFGSPKRGYYCRAYCRPGNKAKGEPQAVMASLHRLINLTPIGKCTDHINGNGLDNRRANLRTCDRSQNNFNNRLRKDSRNGFRGVHRMKTWPECWRCWQARIQVHGNRIYLGYFETKQEAARAYNEAAKKYHGEFARLNPI